MGLDDGNALGKSVKGVIDGMGVGNKVGSVVGMAVGVSAGAKDGAREGFTAKQAHTFKSAQIGAKKRS